MLNVRKCASFYSLIINIGTKILRRDETQRCGIRWKRTKFRQVWPTSRISNSEDKGVHKMRLRGKDLQLPANVYAAAECRDPRNERTFVQLVLKT